MYVNYYYGYLVVNRLNPITFIPWRFYLLLAIIFLVVVGLVARLFDLTILNKGFLEHEGNVRVLRVINTPAFRGMITDRNGYPLAVSTSVYSVWINPQEFTPNEETQRWISTLLSISPHDLQKLMTTKNKHKEFIYLKRGMSPELADKIKKHPIPGMYLQEEYKRFYPEAEVASHVVGFTNVDDKGQEGLELAYDSWLTGTSGKKLVVKDRIGRAISNVHEMRSEVPGKDIILSLDRRIQYLAYRELMEGVEKNIATSGTVVVLDVKTGEVLAMVNQPSFNPNNRLLHNVQNYRNRALTDIFEPGSTMKAFTIASAIEAGKVHANTMVDTSPGWMRVGHNLVQDEHNNGVISVAEILQRSSNVGVTKIILTVPPEKLWNLLHRVGFGEATNSGFPGEQAGSLVNRTTWAPFALATLGFGYGVSVTPMQLAQAYAIFANGGIKIPVSLIKLDQPPVGKRVMSKAVADEMMALLETVTTAKESTVGNRARVPGYRVAGKTGTALIVGAHGYEKHHFTSSFIGIAPVSDPRLVVAVIIHDPQGKHHLGGEVSAPVFEKIMEGSLRLLNVAPDNVDEIAETKPVVATNTPVAKKPMPTMNTLDPFDDQMEKTP